MRILGVVAVLVAVLAILWWWSESRAGGRAPAEPLEDSIEADSTVDNGSTVESPGDAPAASSTETARHEIEIEPAEEEGAVPVGPTSRVFGRVVESSGAGLAGVAIRLYGHGEWAAGVEQAEYETETDEAGHFELVVPVPTSDWVSLIIEPSRFHAFTGRDFGRAGGRNQDPLVEGDNDQGTITLAATGAIAGTVRSASGAALERADVSLDGSYPGGYVIGGRADEHGRYVIEHVPPGVYDIRALARGFLIARLESIEVAAQTVSEGNHLVLESAPAISGRVVDAEAAPIEGVRLWGWPVGSGRGAGANTDAEGRFTIYLPQDEAYSLEGGKPGYDAVGGRMTEDELTFEPGTTDIEIVLQRAVETTFVVVSAASGEPMERFGLSISRGSGEQWHTSTAKGDELVQEIPGAEVTFCAEPGEHSYSIEAPGYAPQHEEVAHDSEESPRQTIRLEAEGRLRGRVLFDGEPVPQATVRVERCRFLRPGEDPNAERDIFDDGMMFDLDGYVGRLRLHTTDAHGVFDIGELATGTWRVELSAAVGSPRSLEELRVTAGELLDLGDLALIAGATVRGRVVVGTGASAPGLVVFLDGDDDNGRTVSADGTVELRGLAPGEHSLVVEDSPGIVLDMEPVKFQVTSGETKDLVLDLAPFQPCRVLVRVHGEEGPLPAATISVRSETGRRRGRIGTTNAEGELRHERLGGNAIQVDVFSPGELYLGSTEGPVEIDPGGDSLIEIQVSPGELAVELPPGYELPEYGRLILQLSGEGRLRADQRLYFDTAAMKAPSFGGMTRRWTGRRSDLGSLAAGRYEVELHVVPLQESSGRYRSDGSEPTILRGEVEVSPGAKALCTLQVE